MDIREEVKEHCNNEESITVFSTLPDTKGKDKRRVHFTEDTAPTKRVMIETSTSELATMGPAINLGHIESTCQYLRQKCVRCLQETEISRSFIGFFEPSYSAGYLFYVWARRHKPTQLEALSKSEFATTLDKLLCKQKDTITNLHQYKIAHKLAMAVLQYHSTPWLNEAWNLSDLLLLFNSDTFPEDVPLFLQSSLCKSSSMPNPTSLPDEINEQHCQLRSSLKFHRGINNMFTFSLGVALLEIAYLKPLAELRTEADTDEIDTARRVADGNNIAVNKLGKGYQEIIQKCLKCDFGYGSDLSKYDLRQAIYNDIAYPMREVIEKLENLGI